MVFEPPPIEPPAPWEPADQPPDPNRHPIRVVVTDDLRRSRLTVGFRLLLSIPLWIWLVIWSIGAFFAAIVNWFLTLIKGRSPLSLHDFFASYIRFTTHLHAYFFFAADPYPSFTGKPGYPVDVEIDPPERQNRWKTLFRLFLALPAFLISGTLSWVLFLVAIFGWFVGLFLGRMPLGLRNLGAYAIRYSAETNAYFFLLTDVYPYSGPWEFAPPRPAPPPPELEPAPAFT